MSHKLSVALKLAFFSGLILLAILHFSYVSGVRFEINNMIIDQDYRWVALVAFFTTLAISWSLNPEGYVGEQENSVLSVFLITVMGWGSALSGIFESNLGIAFATEHNLPAPIGAVAGMFFGAAVGALEILIFTLVIFYLLKGIHWVFKKLCGWLLS